MLCIAIAPSLKYLHSHLFWSYFGSEFSLHGVINFFFFAERIELNIFPTFSTSWQWQRHCSDSVSNTSLGSITTSMPASRTFTYPSSSMTSGAAASTQAASTPAAATPAASTPAASTSSAGRPSFYSLNRTFCDIEQMERLMNLFIKNDKTIILFWLQ